jgi:diadenosine tetraphosphate (Ap4A) HIT family hydrolase
MTAFALDPRLEADTLEVTSLALSVVRLMNDRRFPWVILVPARPGAVEIIDLEPADRARLIEEIALVSATLRGLFNPRKLNVAALGNVVPQLHVHVIARFEDDGAWPRPVWGTTPEPYRVDELDRRLASLRYRLAPV